MDLNLDGKACRVVCWFVKECAVLFYVDKMREVENERNVKRFRVPVGFLCPSVRTNSHCWANLTTFFVMNITCYLI